MTETRFLKSRDIRDRRRHGSTKLWQDVKDGLLTPPIKRGERERVWPEAEVEQILRSELRGESKEQRQALVKRLLESRKEA